MSFACPHCSEEIFVSLSLQKCVNEIDPENLLTQATQHVTQMTLPVTQKLTQPTQHVTQIAQNLYAKCTDFTQNAQKTTQNSGIWGGVGVGGSDSGSGIGSGSDSGSVEARSVTVLSKIGGYPTDFLEFWAVYPKKRNKGDCWKAWRAERPAIATLLDALSWQCTSEDWTKSGGQFVPYPGTYLRARGWEDERPAPNARPSATGAASGPSQQPFRDYCLGHITGPTNLRSHAPDYERCPACRHLKAKYGTRAVGEDELFAVVK